MSYISKLEILKENLKALLVEKENEVKILRIYSAMYFVVKRKSGIDIIKNEALKLLGYKYRHLTEVINYILCRNIILDRKKIIVYNWIFIGDKVISRCLFLSKTNKGYILNNKIDFPGVHYLDLK